MVNATRTSSDSCWFQVWKWPSLKLRASYISSLINLLTQKSPLITARHAAGLHRLVELSGQRFTSRYTVLLLVVQAGKNVCAFHSVNTSIPVALLCNQPRQCQSWSPLVTVVLVIVGRLDSRLSACSPPCWFSPSAATRKANDAISPGQSSQVAKLVFLRLRRVRGRAKRERISARRPRIGTAGGSLEQVAPANNVGEHAKPLVV